ncbi:MAG: amidohydrolase family protein [candidate division Zixibacteria bacterium]|nr:amidohydrolase family protein [candidate division Zixibacteria bacterium]
MNRPIDNSSRIYFARWILTPAGIVENGALELCGNVVNFVGSRTDFSRWRSEKSRDCETVDLGESVIYPGLVNSHCHTAFPPSVSVDFERGSMVDWVKNTTPRHRARPDRERLRDIDSALKRLKETGTVALGEISNSAHSLCPIVRSGLLCRFFAEEMGFLESEANEILCEFKRWRGNAENELQKLKESLGLCADAFTIHSAPHAPHTTSATLLKELTTGPNLTSIHAAEGIEELELLESGTGPWRERLRKIGRVDSSWNAPGMTPVQYLESLGTLSAKTILVHMVHLTEDDLNIIKKYNCRVALCPSSNEYIGVGRAHTENLLKTGVRIGLGTDSLGSNSDLNMFQEMRESLRQNQGLAPEHVWRMATVGGASVLDYADSLGKLVAGKSPGVFSSEVDCESDKDLFEVLIEAGDKTITCLAGASLKIRAGS